MRSNHLLDHVEDLPIGDTLYETRTLILVKYEPSDR